MTTIIISTRAAIRGKLPFSDKTHRVASWRVLTEEVRKSVVFIEYEPRRYVDNWGFVPRALPFTVSVNQTFLTSAKTLAGAIAAANRRITQLEITE